MPPSKAEKRGLTLEKLASYDDVITDALVDKIYYWATIRKNRGTRFTASRGLQEEDIAGVIREQVIWDKDPVEAVQQLLDLPGLRKYMKGLRDEKDQDQFKRHLRRYVNIYMPDCPFEVTTTNRYTITDHEASITARRDINPREEIKYLTGVQVAMTEEQEKTLELARKDFSLVISSRKKTRSLFLGPARFANHDCDANARLSTKGYDGMQIVAVKPINEGDEITVSYGDDYFGDNNEECLCHTCEDRQQNGWAPMKRVEDSDDEDMEEAESPVENPSEATSSGTATSGGKRARDITEEDAGADLPPTSKRARIEKKPSPTKAPASDHLREATLKKVHSTSSLRREMPVSSIEDPSANINVTSPQMTQDIRNQQRDGLLTVSLDETSSSRESTPQSPLMAASPKSSHSTDATSVDDEHHVDSLPKIKVEPEVVHENPALGVATVKEEVITTTIVKRKFRPTLRTTRSKSRYEVHNRVGTPVSSAVGQDGEWVENPRKPGDYMTSSSLLSAKFSKWVECQTCDVQFVQQDGYNTRKECPRCERHSKLYGYAWPKTEREGKHDKEERITDHRIVHRFVDPDEERELKRGKTKKILKESIRERFSTPRSGRESMSASVEVDSGRKRRRVCKTM
ncbi:histone-lysine N-methyltransferase SET9 [Parastagonospora nodorum]|nr:histone-lysine N-methyltransferase SET9 [Parastagonospora nodorum]KAH5242947.1 histone-lysine N-methyltransferase SET9 [Parastagonospora nodorum]KAH5446117.1 histone-lysine N-methyltransferase SET9 [Parastagonospora nodorum]KAH5537326.1 histone-lysine N-methyltransferase SET9 [Parastagonospora nodorum]KAH5693756.1 histone-lysine N-methyltransferase SET9 [Parastagonospora nodorum]